MLKCGALRQSAALTEVHFTQASTKKSPSNRSWMGFLGGFRTERFIGAQT